MNYYDILNIDKTSSQDEIKKSYRKLSLKYHPDRTTGDVEKFKQLNEAYQILGDEGKRKMYDMQSNNPFFGTDGFGNNGQFGNEHMDGILKMFFGGGDPFGNPIQSPNIRIFQNGNPINVQNVLRKPTPIIKTIEITLEQSYNGMNYGLLIERWVLDNNIKKTEKENIYLSIPRGIDNNEIIILKERGNIINDAVKGDIKLFIKVTNNTEFIRDGLNLLYKKKITLKESLTGFSFDINFFNNKKLIINNESDMIIYPKFQKSIDDLGLFRDNKIGKLIIEFEVTFPNTLTEEQKNKLKEIL